MSENLPRVAPFSTGSQYLDWDYRNCSSCAKSYDEDKHEYRCEIQRAIGGGAIDDGTVSAEIGERMGYTDVLLYTWDCPEKEPRA